MPYKTYEVRVYDTGTKEWRLDGKLHNEDGPAIEYAHGAKEWYRNGKLHNEDGPAIEYPDGRKYWYLDGEELTQEQFNTRNKTYNGKVVEIDGVKYRLVKE